MQKTVVLFSALCLLVCLCACKASQAEVPEDVATQVPTSSQTEVPETAISQAPTWQEQYDLGVKYLSEGNCQEAILAFNLAIEIDPEQAPAYVGRGDAYVLSGKTGDNLKLAKTDYEKAIELENTPAEAYLGLADIYIQQENYEKALEVLQDGLEHSGNELRISDKILDVKAKLSYAKVGTYLMDEGYFEPHEFVITELNADGTMMFSVNWYRLVGLTNVKATLNGNRADFDYSDGYVTASGLIDFSSDGTAALTIVKSNNEYLLGTGCSVFEFISEDDLKAEHNARTLSVLCWNTDSVGWVGTVREGEYSSFDVYFLRFYESGDVKIWHEISAGVDWNIDSAKATFSLNGNIMNIGSYQYEAILDHGAEEHLYLTALSADPYGISGTYVLKEDPSYRDVQLWYP